MINCPTCEFADFDKDKCKRLLTRLPHICPYCEERKPKTNADRIRNMTDEELARWIADDLIEPGYYVGDNCYKVWLKWLKEEVKDA